MLSILQNPESAPERVQLLAKPVPCILSQHSLYTQSDTQMCLHTLSAGNPREMFWCLPASYLAAF